VNFLLNPPRRILLIKPSSMGDVIHALPVATALHETWPEAEISWLIQPAFKDLVESHPAISKIILFPREEFRGFFGSIRALRWANSLGTLKPDLALDLQGLLRSALIAQAARADDVIGLSDAREGASFFYSSIATVHPNNHAVVRYMALVKALGCVSSGPVFHLPSGTMPFNFAIQTPFIVIHPYARGHGKNLTQEQVIALARALMGFSVVIVGQGKKMENLPENVSDWTGRTSVLELIGLLRKASFVLSSDSGPMHLAAALKPERLIAIHLWSDPLRIGPWPLESLVWKHGQLKLHHQLTEESRLPGRTPSLEEMSALGRFVLAKLKKI